MDTYNNDETHNVEKLSTMHAIQKQGIVEPTTDLFLSQDELVVIPCDKEDLSSDASFPRMSQVVNMWDTFELYICAEENLSNPITYA